MPVDEPGVLVQPIQEAAIDPEQYIERDHTAKIEN
jgi:hypothetical protein